MTEAVCPIDDLSDDELMARLDNAGVHGAYARQLVDTRDHGVSHGVLHDVLEGRPST